MKIWHQSMSDMNKSTIFHAALQKHAAEVCDGGTEIVIHGLPPKDFITSTEELQSGTAAEGLMSTSDLLGSPYLYHCWFQQIIKRARQAQQEGFDAFVIASFSEPFLRQIRSAVDIPVTSVGESNFLLACSVGKFQAHIANVPAVQRLVSDHVHEYRLADRVSGSYSLGNEFDEIFMQSEWKDPRKTISKFGVLADRAISEGADVIIPTEGVLNELLHVHGIKRFRNAQVLDSVGLAWKYAELQVRLRRRLGLEVGREWEYRRPSKQSLARAMKVIGMES